MRVALQTEELSLLLSADGHQIKYKQLSDRWIRPTYFFVLKLDFNFFK